MQRVCVPRRRARPEPAFSIHEMKQGSCPAADRAASARGSLSHAVRQHVGRVPGGAGIYLGKLVQAQQGVAVRLGDRFEPVVGRPPLPDKTRQPTAAPDRAGGMQRRGFPDARRTANVETSAFSIP